MQAKIPATQVRAVATSSVSIEEVERRMVQIHGVEGHEDEYVYLVSLIAKLEKKAAR